MTITYALIQMLEKVAEKTDRGRIITKACVNKLICNGNAVVGCEYAKGGVQFKEFGPVIFASGGFGADFGQDSLLAKYRPDLLHLPTTNGEHCTGDGIKLGEAIGAKTIPQVSSSQTIQMQRSSSWQLRHFAVWVAWYLI
jgi:aspartate oxidase